MYENRISVCLVLSWLVCSNSLLAMRGRTLLCQYSGSQANIIQIVPRAFDIFDVCNLLFARYAGGVRRQRHICTLWSVEEPLIYTNEGESEAGQRAKKRASFERCCCQKPR